MTNEEAISKEAVMQVLAKLGYGDEENGAEPEYMSALADIAKEVKAIKALEQEPCEDAISKQAVIEILGDYGCTNKEGLLFKDIQELPPVTPKPKTGHWVDRWEYNDCSFCGYITRIRYNYCPNCGAKMTESDDSV